jgi:hypothetical protein
LALFHGSFSQAGRQAGRCPFFFWGL